jgi:hypothetical protein
MAAKDTITSRLSGIPSLVAYSLVTQVQKTDNSLYSRTNAIVTLYAFLRAKYRTDAKVSQLLEEVGDDIGVLRDHYESVLDEESFHIDQINDFTRALDGIFYRLVDVVEITKIIDTAGLREMTVPD